MKNLKRNSLCLLLCAVMALSACDSREAKNPETTSPSEAAPQHEPLSQTEAPSTGEKPKAPSAENPEKAEPLEVTFRPLPQYSKEWWWEHYLHEQAYDFQQTYPSQIPEENWDEELCLLFRYAYENGLAKVGDFHGNDLSCDISVLNKIAPVVLNKPDISHIDMDYMTQPDGTVYYYGNVESGRPKEGACGDWAFTITDVAYPTPYTPQVTVESDTMRRVFYYEQNEHEYYVLKKVTEEYLSPDKKPEEPHFTCSVPYSACAMGLLPQSTDAMRSCGEWLVMENQDFTQYGFYRYSFWDRQDLTKGPVRFLDVSFDYGEKNPQSLLLEDRALLLTTEKLRAYSMPEGELLAERPVPDGYRELVRSGKEDDLSYITDRDIRYMAYSCEEGLFAHDLATGEEIPVKGPLERNRYHAISTVPHWIQDGILYYTEGFQERTLQNLQCFDLRKKQPVPFPIRLPEPLLKNETDLSYDKVIGNKAVASLRYPIDISQVLEICDLLTSQVITVKEPYDTYPGDVLFAGERVFLKGNDTGEQTGLYNELREIHLETGAIGEPIFKADKALCQIREAGNDLAVTCGDTFLLIRP